MKQLFSLALAVAMIVFSFIFLMNPTSFIPKNTLPETTVPMQSQQSSSNASEEIDPQTSEDISTPEISGERQEEVADAFPQQEDTTTALDAESLYKFLEEAYKKKQKEIKVDVLKASFNQQFFADAIKEINKSSSNTNYFISHYEFNTKGTVTRDYVTLDATLQYKEIIDGYSADTAQETSINNYDDFEALVKTAMQSTTEKIKYNFVNNSLNSDVNNLLALVEKVANANRGNYVDKYGIRSFGTGGYVTITYFYPPDQVKKMKEEVNKKADSIIAAIIKPNMTDLEKETALHDYIVLNTKYDKDNFEKNTVPKDSYTPYGTLIKGIAVCEGYAAAMDILLNKVGIESKIITGNANNGSYNGPHAWNLVKLDGNWYHLDATWDDPVPDHPGMVRHDYFNLTDQEIRKNHTF